jgi:hypothetical protein
MTLSHHHPGLAATGRRAGRVPDDLGGRIEAKIDGKPITFPLLKTDIDADVQGDLAP